MVRHSLIHGSSGEPFIALIQPNLTFGHHLLTFKNIFCKSVVDNIGFLPLNMVILQFMIFQNQFYVPRGETVALHGCAECLCLGGKR